MAKEKPCAGCVYYHAYFRANLGCNYIFDEGHRRPCPPGAGCTVKKLLETPERKKRGRSRKQ